jgi:hypothetical protein
MKAKDRGLPNWGLVERFIAQSGLDPEHSDEVIIQSCGIYYITADWRSGSC